MVFSSTLSGTAFLLSRVLFALVIGYLALGNVLGDRSVQGYVKYIPIAIGAAGYGVPFGVLAR